MYIWWSGQPGSGVAVSTLSVSFVPIFYSPYLSQYFRNFHSIWSYCTQIQVPSPTFRGHHHRSKTHIPHETQRFLVHKIPCLKGCTELGAHPYLMHSLFHLASYSYSIDTQVAKCCVTLSGWIRMDWQPLRLPPHPSRAETLFIRIQVGRVFAQYSQFFSVFARTSCAHYTIMPSVSSTASLCFCR